MWENCWWNPVEKLILDIMKQHCVWWIILKPGEAQKSLNSAVKHGQSVDYWNFCLGYQSLLPHEF